MSPLKGAKDQVFFIYRGNEEGVASLGDHEKIRGEEGLLPSFPRRLRIRTWEGAPKGVENHASFSLELQDSRL